MQSVTRAPAHRRPSLRRDEAVALCWHPRRAPKQLLALGQSGRVYIWAKARDGRGCCGAAACFDATGWGATHRPKPAVCP